MTPFRDKQFKQTNLLGRNRDNYQGTSILKEKKKRNPHGFTSLFCQTFKDQAVTVLPKFFQITGNEGTFLNCFYKISIALTPKLDKNSKKRKLQISLMNIDAKVLNKTLLNRKQHHTMKMI